MHTWSLFARTLPVCLVLICLGATPLWAQADKKDDAPPAKPPALTLTIEGEIEPKLAPVVGRFVAVFYESYPKLLERFDHPEKPAPRKIRLAFANGIKVPAYCSGDKITVSIEWISKHPDDLGLLTHELTHAVQKYPNADPGWLTEGLADYARHLYGPRDQPGWRLPAKFGPNDKHTSGYTTTGRFLLWLDGKHPGSVDKLHRKMQDGAFKNEDWQAITGQDVEALWKACVEELGQR